MVEVKKIDDRRELKYSFAVRIKVFVDEQGVPPELEIDEKELPEERFVHFLALADGVPAGTVRMKEFEKGAVKLQRLAVLKEYRKQHIGAALVKAVEQEALRQGYRTVVLDGQVQARPFYERLGYTVQNENEILYDCDIPHLRMQKHLAQGE